MRYIRRLAGAGLEDAPLIGRKAAVLADLAAAGFRVPGGFAVEIGARHGGPAVLAALTAELETALRELGDGPVAVRSSGVVEDLATRSFAGHYTSVLNVRGVGAVLDAVRICWASADAGQDAISPDNTTGGSEVGILVQRMVPAEAAGVAFSANPVTGNRDEVLVSAVTGVADKLTSGARTADEWQVSDGRPTLTATAGGDGPAAVDAEQVIAIAALARAVAAHCGTPQDIEWAYAGGELFLLQARPITTLGVVGQIPIPIEQPEYFSVRDTNVVRPWTRLQTSLFLPVFSDAAAHVFRFTTGATPYASSIGGWTYLTIPPVSPAEQLRRLEEIATRIDNGEPRALVDRWNTEWKPAFRDRLATLRSTAPQELDDAGLHAYLSELIALFRRLHDVYFRLSGAGIVLLAELGVAARDLLGWTPAQTLRLRGGLHGDHMAVAVGLSKLARMAAARPAVRKLVDECPPGVEQLLDEADPEFAEEFRSYREAHGHRTVGFDLTEPTLAEQPGLLVSLLGAQLDHPFDLGLARKALRERLDAVLGEAEPVLAASDEDRRRFAEALAGSDLAAPVRDEKVYYAVSLWALLRYALLDLGRRLAAAGRVDQPEDVWHLDLDAALAALDRSAGLHDEVRLGRGRHAWAIAHPGPRWYGPPPAGFDDAGLPQPSAGARHVGELAQWSMSLRAVPDGGETPDGALRGLAASAGRYTGRARVIRNITEFGKVRHGDVLVCPETTAQWAVLFPGVGALVTDNGSVLSHPAIISREYGVPAVLATGNATTTFTDGQLLTVDGTTGLVRLANVSEGLSS